MDTIRKIVGLIPENWDEVLAQSEQFESYVNVAQLFVGAQKSKGYTLLESLFSLLNVDGKAMIQALEKTAFYQHLDKVSLDLPAWLSLPDGATWGDFDWNDETKREALIKEKFTLLKKAFDGFDLTLVNGHKVNTDAAIDALRSIVALIGDAVSTLDVEPFNSSQNEPDTPENSESDQARLQAIKDTLMQDIKPKLMALVTAVFGVDFSEKENEEQAQNAGETHSSTNQSSSNQSLSLSQRADILADIPEKVVSATTESTASVAAPGENNNPDAVTPDFSHLPENIAQVMTAFSMAKTALPVLQTEVQKAAPELENVPAVASLFEMFSGSLDHLQEYFPSLAESVTNLVTGQDWENIDTDKLKTELQQLSALGQLFLRSSPLVAQVQAYLAGADQGSGEEGEAGFGANSPVQLVGFAAGTSTEDKLTTLMQKAQSLLTMPSDLNALPTEGLIQLGKDKLDAVVDMLSHIQILGITPLGLYDKVKSPVETFLNTDGFDLSSPENVIEFVIDKSIGLIESFFTADSNLGDRSQSDGASNASAENNGSPDRTTAGNVLRQVVAMIKESIIKIKIIIRFLRENDVGIRLEDRSSDFAPAQVKSTQYQVAQGTVPASSANGGDEPSGAQADEKANSEASNGAGAASAQSSGNQSSQGAYSGSNASLTSGANIKASDVISTEQIIRNLLGDRDSGVVSALPKEAQDLIMGVLDGEFVKQAQSDVVGAWQASQIEGQLTAIFNSMQSLANGEIPQNTPSTLADLVSLMANTSNDIFVAGIALFKAVMRLLIDWVFKLINMVFETIKAFRVPSALRHFLPDQIESALLGDNDPNLICLLLAMPTTLVKGFLSLTPAEMEAWAEQAA